MDELTRKRLERNEQVFRRVNEEIDDRAEAHGDTEYVCECFDTACAATVRLDHDAYRAVRAHPDRYVVAPGHYKPELERVVDDRVAYYVVEKF